jgi:hypothetical protein
MTTATQADRLVSGRTRPWIENFLVRLTCSHSAVVHEAEVHGEYRFTFCKHCHEVRDFAKKRPAVRRIQRF